MKTSKSSPVKSTFTCGRCSMLYFDYKRLLEHLYWRHGTESSWCQQCRLKRWGYAAHVCHVLPINYSELFEEDDLNSEEPQFCVQREADYCFCGKYVAGASMIGCDSPNCSLQWYHFACVGITTPPAGDWFCPRCVQLQKMTQTKVVQSGIET